MKIFLKDVHSSVQAQDSQSLLDPRVMRHITKICVEAVKEDMAREKRRAQDRELTNGVAPERQ